MKPSGLSLLGVHNTSLMRDLDAPADGQLYTLGNNELQVTGRRRDDLWSITLLFLPVRCGARPGLQKTALKVMGALPVPMYRGWYND